MAKADDGRVIKEEDRANGQLVASPSSTSSRKRAQPRRSWTAWVVNNILRIATWYSIITVLFRCPSDPSALASTSPSICKPYLSLRTYVDPYIGPYYDAYASPYVEKARPYVDTANTRIIRPATVLAIDNYNKYAAPEIAKAKDYTWSRWEANGLPQLKKAQEAAQQAYDDNLAPHVQKASEVAAPYFETARENALNVHEKHIIPAITYSQPHVQAAYVSAQRFALEKGLPFVQHAWTNLVIFVDGTLWPFIKRMYGDNVRPQLVMIGERIAKYQEGRKLQSVMNEVDATSNASVVTQSAGTTPTPATEVVSPTTIAEEKPTSTHSTSSTQVATEETVTEDLVTWQKKFAVAADKGTDDLRERIEEIVHSMVKSDIGEGQGLATALERTAEVALDNVKAKIKAVASTLPRDAEKDDESAAESEVMQAIREAGSQIKERAKAVRSWAEKFKGDLHQRTELATESTLQVLDDIRDLSLQEIGMRWAWMDGITYKHWAKYHDLKKRFADWRSEVREISLSHTCINDAQEQADKVLEESMAATEHAARELIRLRDVAKWKIAARDATDDFDTREIPVVAVAAEAASSLAAEIKDAIVGTSQGSPESISSVISDAAEQSADGIESLLSQAASTASSVSASASSFVLGSTGTVESLSSDAAATASSALSDASFRGSSAASKAFDAAGEAVSSASSIIIGTSQGTFESLSSSLVDEATSALHTATAGPSEGVLSSASSFVDSISSSAPSAVASASASQVLKEKIDEAGEKVAESTSSLRGKYS